MALRYVVCGIIKTFEDRLVLEPIREVRSGARYIGLSVDFYNSLRLNSRLIVYNSMLPIGLNVRDIRKMLIR